MKGDRDLKVTGSYTFDADVQTVWDSMLSPDVLSGCIPGCDRFVPSGDDSYDVDLTVRIASIRGAYKGTVKIEDKVHLQSYRMVVTGSGRGGSVQGSGDLSFSETTARRPSTSSAIPRSRASSPASASDL